MAEIRNDEDAIRSIERWRQVFLTTKEGRAVLAELLEGLHFFDMANNEAEQALRNHAAWILFRLGIFNDDNMLRIVDKLSEISYNIREE